MKADITDIKKAALNAAALKILKVRYREGYP